MYTRSSFLSTPSGMLVCFMLAAAALAFRQRGLAVFLILAGVLAVISRKWAFASLREVRFEADSARTRFFPDETFALKMKVENRKSLPLIWLEAALPLVPDGPLEPVEKTGIRRPGNLTKEDEELPDAPMLFRRFAFLAGGGELCIDVEMKAVRRGIFSFGDIRLYSGDGLGLTQVGMRSQGAGRLFAVYPRPVPVRAEVFLKNQWTSAGSARGYMEEPTLIRGSRDYQPSDSWKRINWRLAARGLPLNVNLPEMIRPQASHFVVDGESFSGEMPDDEGFELMLSVLASVFIRMDEAGLSCGLTLPKSLRSGAVTMEAGTALSELLFALAAYERRPFRRVPAGGETKPDGRMVTGAGKERPDGRRDSAAGKQPVSSYETVPALRAMRNAGSIYYLTRNVRAADNKLLKRLGDTAVTLIPLEEADEQERAFYRGRILQLRSLLK